MDKSALGISLPGRDPVADLLFFSGHPVIIHEDLGHACF